MKDKSLILLLILISFLYFSQEKLGRPFLTFKGDFTLGINEDYVSFYDVDGETLIAPEALFVRFGFGYQFKKRVAVAFNTGYDFRFNYDVGALPTYGSLRYNITEKDDSNYFIEASYRKNVDTFFSLSRW